jgi:hypothetical protein
MDGCEGVPGLADEKAVNKTSFSSLQYKALAVPDIRPIDTLE